MGPVHPLVPEVLPDLVDALEPAHDEPLEIQLVRDAEVERHVERVVVRRERPGERAPVRRLQDGRLDLQKAALLHEAPDAGHDRAPEDEHAARVVVRDEIEIAMAEPEFLVAEPVPLLGEGPQGLRQHVERGHPDAHLTALRLHDLTAGPDHVAQVEELPQREAVLSDHVRLHEELDAPLPVLEVREDRLPVPADGRQAAADSDVASLERRVVPRDVGRPVRPLGAPGVRVNAALAQAREVLAHPRGQTPALGTFHVVPLLDHAPLPGFSST